MTDDATTFAQQMYIRSLAQRLTNNPDSAADLTGDIEAALASLELHLEATPHPGAERPRIRRQTLVVTYTGAIALADLFDTLRRIEAAFGTATDVGISSYDGEVTITAGSTSTPAPPRPVVGTDDMPF